MRTTTTYAWTLAALLTACGGDPTASGTDTSGADATGDTGDTRPGDVTDTGDATGGIDPDGRQTGGRTPRRLGVDQVRVALEALTGQTYRGGAWVFDPLDPEGQAWRTDADLLDAFGGALGRPDYNYTVVEGLDAGMTFAKFVQDAARSVCRGAVEADVATSAESRHILLRVEDDDTLASAEPAMRDNIAELALRFWGRDLAPDSPEVNELIAVFNVAATTSQWVDEAGTLRLAGTSLDGWRAVCVAMVTDAQFYVY